jgi:hypothetical protein
MKFLVSVLIVVVIGLTVVLRDQGTQIDRLQRQLCGFVFYEDGSIAMRSNDDARFACMGK